VSFEAAVKRSLAAVSKQTPPLGVAVQPRVELRATAAVLRARDVGATVAWYESRLGFQAERFPPQAPHEFALLTRDRAQLMIRRAAPDDDAVAREPGWDLFIRVADGELVALFAGFRGAEEVVRPLEHMPYGDLEFELRDPDGHVVCLGEHASEAGRGVSAA
jgi:catechol 2,3-dioxygenase-like lactoylglutathione lyase family enzyme